MTAYYPLLFFTGSRAKHLKPAREAVRATVIDPVVAFDARLQHFGNKSSATQYKVSLTFISRAELDGGFQNDTSYSLSPFRYPEVRVADLFRTTTHEHASSSHQCKSSLPAARAQQMLARQLADEVRFVSTSKRRQPNKFYQQF
jgi:hypothetical protein